jgi:hypothetical protein
MGHAEEIIGQPNLPAKWKSSLCLLRMFQKGSLSLCFSTSHFFGEGTCTFVSPTQEGCSGQYVTQCCCPEPSLAVPPQTVDAGLAPFGASVIPLHVFANPFVSILFVSCLESKSYILQADNRP